MTIPKSLQSTKIPGGRVKVGESIRHRNRLQFSTVTDIIKGDNGVTIWTADNQRIDPLYVVKEVPQNGGAASAETES